MVIKAQCFHGKVLPQARKKRLCGRSAGRFEHHITADVAIAAWNYYCVTQDKIWLREKGYPILKATADFWASRVERNGPNHYDIKNVVAADEWAENVDNNAFTNAAAKANLQYATEAAKVLGYHFR